MKNFKEIFNRIDKIYNSSSDMLYEMQSLFENEKKYDIQEISKIAYNNMQLWVPPTDWMHFKNELQKGKAIYAEEAVDIFYDFLNKYIDKFLQIFSRQFNVEIEFLQERRDEIIYNVMEHFIPEVKDRNEVSNTQLPGDEEMEEDPIIAKALRQSREKQKPSAVKDYSKMSKFDLRQEVDKALDNKDYDTLKKIQPFLKEGFLKYHVDEILNEEYLMKPLSEGCGCGGKKIVPGLIKRPSPQPPRSVRPRPRPSMRPGATR